MSRKKKQVELVDEDIVVDDKEDKKKGKKKKEVDKDNLREIESTQQILPIQDVRDDLIVTKQMEYYKLMEVSPINFELRAPEEQDAIISEFGGVIKTWPKDVHIKIVTTPTDVASFIKGIQHDMELEQSENCKLLQQDQIDMLERISQTQGVSRRFFISFGYEDPGGFAKAPTEQLIKRALDDQGRQLQYSLEGCGNSLCFDPDAKRDSVLSALYTTICKNQSDYYSWEERKEAVLQNYQNKYGETFSERQIPAVDFVAPAKIESAFSPNYIVIDGKYVMYCYLPSDAYPVRAVGGWMQILFSYLDDVAVDFWVHKESIESVQRKLQFTLKNNKIAQKHVDDISIDYDNIVTALQAGYYIKEALSKGDDFCYISTMITLYADSEEELMQRFTAMKDYCVRNDMRLKKCTFQQMDAFLSTLPFARYNEGIFKKSKRNVMATQLGSCYPFTAYELCDKGGVFLGINSRYNSPVFINHFDTARYKNANMMIFGPSGSGKTYTLMCLLLRMRQKGIQIFVIAPFKGEEFYRACKAIDGEFIRIAPGSPQNINVMEIRKQDTSDAGDANELIEGASGSLLVDKIQQLHRFFSIIVPDISASEKQVLDETLMKTYNRFGITPRNKSLWSMEKKGSYKTMPTLGDLHEDLKEAGPDGRRIYNLLSRFVTGSAKSFNQQTNVNLNNKFVIIDVSSLTNELLPMGMFIALDYVLDKAKEDKTKRKVIAIDEMWRLMRASQMSAEFTVEVFKIIRGYAGSAIGATQDLDDVLKSEHGAAIINNSQTKILLQMDKKEANAAAKVIELSSEELKQLKQQSMVTSTGKRRASKALMIANSNHIFINIKASKKEHDLITTSREDLERLKKEFGLKNE